MPSPERTKSIYRWLSLGLLLLCVGIGFATIRDYGMGWDEVTRWNSGDAKVDYYKSLFAAENPMEVIGSVPADSYPGFFDMPLSFLHRLTGWNRLVLGHWQAFVFGLVGLIALWRIGSIFGGTRLGFWSALFLILTPTFYGHWFHNPKDIPFAATYTVGLWALVECFRRYPALSKRWLLAVAVASGMCMATRIAGMVLLAYFAAGVGVVVLTHLLGKRTEFSLKESARTLWPWLLAMPLVALGAYLTLLPWWPSAHKDLLAVSGSTLQRLHVSASEIPLFFRGTIMWAADAPFYYTLWMFAIKATELLLVGLLLCLPFGYLRSRNRIVEGAFSGAPALAVLLLGGCFPLLYLTATAPALHNGVRHFLFAFPALCVCSAWGYLECAEWLRARCPARLRLARVGFVVLLFVPVFYLIRLHPYEYVYFNSLAGGPAVAHRAYESEYWFTSSQHALEQLEQVLAGDPSLLPVHRPVNVFVLGPWQVAEPFLPADFALSGDPDKADFLILNAQMRMHERFAGEELFRIERMGAPICIVLKAAR